MRMGDRLPQNPEDGAEPARGCCHGAAAAVSGKAAADIPIHRILAADSSLLSRHIPQQMQRLQAEGVEVVDHHVSALY